MSQAFFPRLLPMPLAYELADLRLVRTDLVHVKKCCSMLLDGKLCMLTSPEGGAFLDSLCIRYRRCFGKGVRTPLKLSDLKLSPASQELHDYFYNLADKHIAHSVNHCELNATTLHIAISEDGKVTKGGLGNTGTKTVGLALFDIACFESHVESLIQHIDRLDEKYTRILTTEVLSMTDEEVKALPLGFAPLENMPVIQKRKWPQ